MKMDMAKMMGFAVVAVVGALALVGCNKPATPAASTPEMSNTDGVAERTGAALDRAAVKTVEVASNMAAKTSAAAKNAAVATKEAARVVVEKTGATLEKAGAAVEKTGAGMQQ